MKIWKNYAFFIYIFWVANIFLIFGWGMMIKESQLFVISWLNDKICHFHAPHAKSHYIMGEGGNNDDGQT